ncbi:hypothetical protein Bxe_A3649 [Paraburkholderia xenovorans LB400]|jgi:hypothetical protein|uniref:Uncharacterized protein n=1 Tax=Paraburkholderia xenovorans (strain LB400) TaxID=266265 RepID=Q144A0_PARXL|nr:hypothetical protein Bxe_A3649 [Paraburkholderia xenovorans LB400]
MIRTSLRPSVETALFVTSVVVAIFLMFRSGTEPVISCLQGSWLEPVLLSLHDANSIVFNLAVGYIVSVFFWIIIVYVPQRRQRAIIRSNLLRGYMDFREGTISVFLFACQGSYESSLPGELLDHRRFKEFFGGNNSANWSAVLNELGRREDYLSDLLMEMQIFADEVAYALDHVDVNDPNVHAFFKRLKEQIYRLKNRSQPAYDSYEFEKSLGRFMWEVHSRWSFASGQHENDIIEDMIRAL